jgi:YegS/Rv2252/BmrU family lipid kinase
MSSMTDEQTVEQARRTPPRAAQITVIVNATSGADDKEEACKLLERVFSESGVEPRMMLAQRGSEIVEFARRAAQDEDSGLIVAGGGDGTISAVASELVGTQKTLGVLPMGTLNHFAKDLHIPLDLEEAARVCLTGHAVSVDVGEVNGRTFLNNSSLGLYPQIVRRREKQQERLGRGKWLAFVWATLAVLRRYPFLDVRLSMEERNLRRRTPFVFIGNNEYEMENLNVGARSCLDAGHLSLYVTHRTGRLGLLRLALRALFGGLRNERDFDALCTKEVWIETKRKRLSVATDGEVTLMNMPLHYRVLPGALRVLVPHSEEEAAQG